jgi:hypothetical protein
VGLAAELNYGPYPISSQNTWVGRNPFGFAGLDIKAYYMGATGCRWADTRSSAVDAALNPTQKSDHHALHDAQYQAELFRLIRRKAMSRH